VKKTEEKKESAAAIDEDEYDRLQKRLEELEMIERKVQGEKEEELKDILDEEEQEEGEEEGEEEEDEVEDVDALLAEEATQINDEEQSGGSSSKPNVPVPAIMLYLQPYFRKLEVY
jgi:hypothetical protein